jgi:Protein of unknown function (DUF3592)
VEARGIVVDIANVREYDSDLERDVTRPYPVVEFVTAREQVVRYQPPRGQQPTDYRPGGPLKVLYDPADPQHAVLDTWDDVWKMGVVCSCPQGFCSWFSTQRCTCWCARGG